MSGKLLLTIATQEVWETVLPMVNKAFDGYNVTLFTYGMTGSGTLSPQSIGLFDANESIRYYGPLQWMYC